MGNRALRKELGKRIGKFRKTSRLAGNRFLHAKDMRQMIHDFDHAQPGMLVANCDGFNHRVAQVVPEWYRIAGWDDDLQSPGKVVCSLQVQFEHGWLRCPCCPVQPPETREQIEQGWKRFCEDYPTWEGETAFHKEARQRIEAGEPICDDDGVMLPDLQAFHA